MIRTLARHIKEYKKDSLLAPAFMILEVTMEVTIPLLMAFMIDFGINQGRLDIIFLLGGALVVTAFISLFAGIMSGHYAAKASAGYAKNLRKAIYYSVQDFSFQNLDRFSVPGLITRSTTDITNVQYAYQMIIRIAVRAPGMLIFAFIMAFNLNSRLSVIYLAVIPFMAAGLYMIIRYARPLFERVFRTYDKLNKLVQENIRGIRVVKSFVREEYEKEKFSEVSNEIYRDFSKAEKILAFNTPLLQFSMYITILLISWFGAHMIVNADMTTGQLVSMFAYTLQILMSLMMLSMVFVMIIISRESAKRIAEVLNEKSDMENPESPIHEVKDGEVIFENVTFSYSKGHGNLCLIDINLHIESGQTVGIIGSTGSSKSTLIHLIPRLYDVKNGSVKVGGIDVREYDLTSLRNSVAVVLQKNLLFSGNVKENLRWGNPDADDEELIRVCRLAQAHDFIESFPLGYETIIEQGGANVSGGQKQRLCIARALLKKPKILIMDDSTSAVDTKTDALIRKALINEIPDTTKIIIAQRIASVMDADKIIVMDSGKIMASGTHKELLKTCTIYKEIYISQLEGGMKHEIE